MREIKFRAWDTIEKKMRYEALEIKDIGLGDGSVIASQEVQTDNPLKWMQYTGLKDKNKEEIYEGDILEYNYGNPINREIPNRKRDVVEFDGYTWICGAKEFKYLPKDLEIIGDIYENPELIN